jgi:hypothetical protein
MNKFVPLALLATVAALALVPSAVFAAKAQQVQAPAAASSVSVSVTTGKMLYGADGHRIASVYHASANGDAQLILDGRLVTVPASTLTEVNGKLTTSLSKTEIAHR